MPSERQGDWGVVYATEEDPDYLVVDHSFGVTAAESLRDIYPTDTIAVAVVRWDGTNVWETYTFSEEELALRTFSND